MLRDVLILILTNKSKIYRNNFNYTDKRLMCYTYIFINNKILCESLSPRYHIWRMPTVTKQSSTINSYKDILSE